VFEIFHFVCDRNNFDCRIEVLNEEKPKEDNPTNMRGSFAWNSQFNFEAVSPDRS